MGDFLGADVAELRDFARDLSAASEKLSQTSTMLSQRIAQGRGWQGPDAQRFSADWDSSLRPALMKAAAGLANTGKELLIQAREQDTASHDSGSSGISNTAIHVRADGDGRTGHDTSKPRYADQGRTDLSNDELAKLKKLMDLAADNNNFFRGNDNDVENLRKAFEKLSPAELDQLLKTLSDDDLKALADGAGSDGKGILDWQGTTPFERQGLLDQLLSKASAEQVARIKEQFSWAQPDGTAQGDAARPGGGKSDETNKWMSPGGPVVGENPGKDDISQGGYGDCVVMAGAGALVAKEPAWVRDHVTDNGNGTVSVKLFDNGGHERWITVTSDLPADDKGDQRGAQTGKNGSWPAYVEKALTQVYGEDNDKDPVDRGKPADQAFGPGEYRAIEGNYGPDVMHYLTGQDVSTTDHAKDLWQAVQNGQPAIVTTLGKDPQGAPEGYYSSHAYFVEGIDSDGNLVLQNPWGPTNPKMRITPDQFEDLFNDASIVSQ